MHTHDFKPTGERIVGEEIKRCSCGAVLSPITATIKEPKK